MVSFCSQATCPLQLRLDVAGASQQAGGRWGAAGFVLQHWERISGTFYC
jgi:hypothetical protein